MVEQPEKMIGWFVDAGADHITFHFEATVHVHRLLQQIHSLKCKAGISIVPSTPASALTEVLSSVDLILVMTVNPGFGGQELIPECVSKVKQLHEMREQGAHDFLIVVDGGVNRQTAGLLKRAGADVLVTGSAFFAADNASDEVQHLRNG